VTNDTTIRYLEDRDTCLGEEVSSVVSRSNYKRERAFGALSASRARFLSRSIIRRSHFRVFPIIYAIPDDLADGIEKKGRRCRW